MLLTTSFLLELTLVHEMEMLPEMSVFRETYTKYVLLLSATTVPYLVLKIICFPLRT